MSENWYGNGKQLSDSAVETNGMKRRKLIPNSPSKSILEFKTNSSSSSSSSSKSKSKSILPPNVIVAIFTRLPVKSLLRFRCVAKFCYIIIRNPSFAIIHQPNPRPKPGLLITFATKLQLAQTFFTADQNGGVATRCLTIPPRFSRYTTQSNGIVCMDFGIYAKICNPSTRQAITLPYLCSKNSIASSSTYFCVNFIGFDPNSKQYKILNSWGYYKKAITDYRVFTLGTKKWRPIHGGPPFYAQRENLCINGIIFFRSWVSLGTNDGIAVLISFDVQTETFRVIHLPKGAPSGVETSCLIQLSGCLVIVDYQLDYEDYSLWVLEDYWNEIWTQHYIVFPLYLKKMATGQNLVVAGTSIETGEIIMAPQCLSTPFYVYYYDLPRANFRRVKILGLPEYDSFDLSSNLVSVTNYVENILALP